MAKSRYVKVKATGQVIGGISGTGSLETLYSDCADHFSKDELEAGEEEDSVIAGWLENQQPYGNKRRSEYPDIGDQLDDLYHKGAFSDEMAAKLKAVKDKYAKE
jgi:hypothetical protein